jgi:hypothetical protein
MPGCLTLPSPKERVIKKSEVKVLSFGEDYSQVICFLTAFMNAAQFR